MDLELWVYPAVIAAGFGCGFINTLAGSGSLITLPLLIFLGLPANTANGTNRIAILFQNIIGVRTFSRQKVLDHKRAKWLLLPSVLGAVAGAGIAVTLNERIMRLVIALIMVLMLGMLLFKPKHWLSERPGRRDGPLSPLEWIAFFAVGLYGGFIQAGVGIFLLSVLVMVSGYDLVKANAIKVLIILGFTPFALMMFVLNDQVVWHLGLIMALGSMLGAWVGARTAIQGGARFVRWVLLVVVAASAVKLLADFFLA